MSGTGNQVESDPYGSEPPILKFRSEHETKALLDALAAEGHIPNKSAVLRRALREELAAIVADLEEHGEVDREMRDLVNRVSFDTDDIADYPLRSSAGDDDD